MPRVKSLVNHPTFEKFIIAVIILSAVVIGLETSPSIYSKYGNLLKLLDNIIIGVFCLEIILKMIAALPRPLDYFKSGWNIFDFTIVAICLIPAAGPWAAVLRLARILRTARLISQVPQLQILVNALLKSLPSMFYVSVLLSLLFYIYAVLATFLFRDNDPAHFDNVGLSMVSLFRIITLEDWTDIMYTAYYGSDIYNAQGPIPIGADPQAHGVLAILFFISFVVIGAMIMINLFIGVMIQSLSRAETAVLREKLHLDQIESKEKQITTRLQSIEEEISRIKEIV